MNVSGAQTRLPDEPRVDRGPLVDRFAAVRAASSALVEGLSAEDQVVQSMPDASPTKWHLAHFFEPFILQPRDDGSALFDAQ